ncbi:MAG: MFS transporter [Planctomycetota bacterium]|jgi:MFS family permease
MSPATPRSPDSAQSDKSKSDIAKSEASGRNWFLRLNKYQWFVLVVAALGWLFDTMDQQLFALARTPAMRELLAETRLVDGQPQVIAASKDDVNFYGGICTSVFMIGWAVGGLIFGVLGDRYGRVRVMLWTILLYSLFTGLSSFSRGIWDFALFRFLTGLGVGGEFAVGVALVAEVMPNSIRQYALGFLQSCSTIGNVTAAVININLGIAEGNGALKSMELAGQPLTAWRLMFLIGALPALLVIVIRARLKEPESWVALQAGADKSQLGSYRELFSVRWRRNAIVGFLLGLSGVVGLWGIGFFTFDLINVVATSRFEAEGLAKEQVAGKVAFWVGMTSVMLNAGAFFGMNAFSYMAASFGRKPTFLLCLILAALSTILVYSQLDQFHEIFWMVPLMGFWQLSLFGGYAIYFPELFPTRLRSTGVSFCYNVGRLVAAVGPLTLGYLTKYVFNQENGYQQGFRWAAISMCSFFLVGIVALAFAPETKDQPLPE